MRRSSFTWWQVAWFVVFISGFVFRGRTAAEISNSAIDGWALYRIGCVFIVGLILFVRLTLRKTRWLPTLFSGFIGIFLLYPLISLASTSWSVLPPWTLYKSLEFMVDLATLAAILATIQSAEEYKKLVNWTWILLGLLVLSAWVGAAFDPADALFADPNTRVVPLRMRLVGVLPVVSCNDLSEICATLALVALCRLWADPDARPWKTRYRLLFVVSMVTLVVTQTRGSFIAFFIGVIVLLILTRRYVLAAAGGFVCTIAGALLLLFTNFGSTAQNFINRGQSVKESSGWSGRLETWQNAYSRILEHPWIGYGGFAGARFVVLDRNSPDSSSLNSFIDVALNIGILGPMILLLVVVLAGWVLFRRTRDSWPLNAESYLALEMLIALVVLVVRSVESSNLITHPMLAFLVVLGAAEVLRHHRKTVPAMSPQRVLSWQS
jgi:O-antigen ligase